MDIRQLTYFIAIAEEKNISRAAEKLHIAQPPLSQQLKMLEDELGVKLIERSTRKLEITDVGQALQHKAKQILELVDATVREVKDIDKGLQGILSIGSIASFGSTYLPKIMTDFHKTYPNVNFHVVDEDTEKIIELLTNGIIDIGIVRTPVNHEIFESLDLPDDPMVAIDNNMESSSEFIDLINLKNKFLIVQRRYEKLIVDLCREKGFEPKILCRSNDVRTILLWADMGLGTAILPKICTGLINNKDLSYKELINPSIKIGTAAIWIKKRYLSTVSQHYLNIFKSHVEKMNNE